MSANTRMIGLLQQCRERGASDLHLSAGSRPALRINGILTRVEDEAVSAAEASDMALSLLDDKQKQRFQEMGEVDFSYNLEPYGRYRINVYRQQGLVSLAARLIPNVIPSLNLLQLPGMLAELIHKPQGLILVTGPTGSGKSSTLAALIGHMNSTLRKHIITLEDPIEFVHKSQMSIIEQREVGNDTLSFANGLRAALRQDPDVILVGEMRDLETISAAITAAETGHLVLATLHTSDAPQTIDRIIDAFPAHQQAQIRTQLASVLVTIVSQRLLPKPGGKGRTAATEILVNTPAVANLIRLEKVHQIQSVMQTGRALGMHTLEMSIKELLQQGQIDPISARAYVSEGGF